MPNHILRARFKRIGISLLVLAGLLAQPAVLAPVQAESGQLPLQSDNPNPPATPVKLIFIHHSTGQNWLDDSNGGLGKALGANNYFASDTNYGWGPNSIGDRTDIPNWLEWFRSTDTPTYMNALYAENGIHSPYTRSLANPGGTNQIIMFKSCFPNSALAGNPDDPPSASGWLTVGHAKYVYNEILKYFGAHPEKLFVVITAPPLIDGTYAANARAFNQWLMNDWLVENAYTLKNVAVFDFYNVLTAPGAHHRYNTTSNQVEHTVIDGMNTEYYPSSSNDDHPSKTGNLKATSEFIALLNIFYNRWQSSLHSPKISGCPVYPADNIWNTPVNNLPVDSHSTAWINFIGRNTGFHMDFGSGSWDGGPIGIPYNLVDDSVPKVEVSFYYPGESDPGPYPIPASPLIEYGSDHHILIVDSSTCTLYELYDASLSGGKWSAGSGAIWDLGSNALRPAGWTSADAAGLPMLPGLVRYDEILSGQINHAIRFTASTTNGFIWPARHHTDPNPGAPPMGARFRLKASFNISGYSSQMQVLLRAMKTYGIILADNGSDWYVSGAPDEGWDNDMLHTLDALTGNDFEAVDSSGLMVNPNSGQARRVPLPPPGVPSPVSPANGALVSSFLPRLDWTDAAGTQHYRVQVSKSSSFGSLVVDKNNLTSSEYSLATALAANTTWYWRVRAYNSSGLAGAWSTVRSFRTKLSQPVPIAPVGSVKVGSLKPTFRWNPVAGATGYNLQVSVNTGFAPTLINQTLSTGTSYTATANLPAHATLYWRLRANGPNGPSDWMTTATFKTP